MSYFLFRRRNLWPLLSNVEKLMSVEKKNYRELVLEHSDQEVLIQKDITRTYPEQKLFEKKSLTHKNEHDPFDYVFNSFLKSLNLF